MKKQKVILLKGYHGGEGFVPAGQSIEVTSDHAKQLAKDGLIEVPQEKEEKKAVQTKEEKSSTETK